jgi:hypothetical protein
MKQRITITDLRWLLHTSLIDVIDNEIHAVVYAGKRIHDARVAIMDYIFDCIDLCDPLTEIPAKQD